MPGTANSIITPQTIKSSNAVTVTANTTYTDAPTNTAVLWTAGVNGDRITKLTSLARATLTATELQLFRSSDGGTTKRFFGSLTYAAFTQVQNARNPTADWPYSESNPLTLGPNEILYVAQGVTLAAGIVHVAEGCAF
ncbi:hypothetical protein [Caulobacter henricii]|uniref:Uncharacterized protein n=1 Tax=Caulobacter henricii TaxID=69395 RepID=A0A0P0P161_9CAUL|nr:hypothetical protein [Caulobacter henricii]ALL14253.1 hypothetical protein AQ619_13385 [Caulobacter henricii]